MFDASPSSRTTQTSSLPQGVAPLAPPALLSSAGVRTPRLSTRALLFEDASIVPWWGSMSLLWGMFVPLCVALYTLCLPIGANDFWYHARAGRTIWESGAIPQTALFSAAVGPRGAWTTAATPYFYQSWIADTALYLLLRVGGLGAINIARSALTALAFLLLIGAGWRRARRLLPAADPTTLARWSALGGLFGFGMCALNMDTRPQMFSVPLFAAFLAALWEWPSLEGRGRWRLGALLCCLMALWSNTHGAFITSLALVGVYAGGESLSLLWQRCTVAGDYSSLRASVLRAFLRRSPAPSLWLLFAALCGAAMVNPRGWRIFVYALHDLPQNVAGRRYIAEWQPPHVSPSEWYNGVFFASFLILPALWCRVQRRREEGTILSAPVTVGEGAMLLLLAGLGCQMTRGVIWYGLAAVPVLAALGVAAFSSPHSSAAPLSRGVTRINAVLALMLALLVVPLLPGIKAQLPWPLEFRARFAPNPPEQFPAGFATSPPLLLDKATPIEAVEYLRAHPPRGRLWNDMVFGSYLTWAVAPRIKPACCPRVELYPLQFWETYGQIMKGPLYAPVWLQKAGYTDALLDREYQPKLITRLKGAGWKVLFMRRNAVLLRRGGALSPASLTTLQRKTSPHRTGHKVRGDRR